MTGIDWEAVDRAWNDQKWNGWQNPVELEQSGQMDIYSAVEEDEASRPVKRPWNN